MNAADKVGKIEQQRLRLHCDSAEQNDGDDLDIDDGDDGHDGEE